MAKEILLNTINKSATQDTLEQYLTERQISRLMTKEPITFKHHNLLGAAIYYPDNQGILLLSFLRTTVTARYSGADFNTYESYLL